MKKNVWSMVLALALVLSLLPVSVLAAESDTAYDIWVGGVQVTADNASDVLGDGTVSYDAETNTLTLSNAVITTGYEYRDERYRWDYYTIVDGDGKTAQSVTIRDAVNHAAQYHDLVAGEWYHESVNFVLEKGLMNGVGNGKFDPTGTTSRAMIATILWREAGCPVVNYLMPFEDVPAESWYTEAVRWAASEGIITGYDGLFDSEGAITREQMVTMLYRYARKTQENVPEYPEDSQVLSLVFKDSDSVSTYANAAMQWAYHAGVIGNEGVGNGCLAPRQEMIRAEVAQMLMNYLK